MEFLFFIPMKQVPQDELKPRSLSEQSSWLLKPAHKYRANFGICQMREKNVFIKLTSLFVYGTRQKVHYFSSASFCILIAQLIVQPDH